MSRHHARRSCVLVGHPRIALLCHLSGASRRGDAGGCFDDAYRSAGDGTRLARWILSSVSMESNSEWRGQEVDQRHALE
jgi:hypothetical protein